MSKQSTPRDRRAIRILPDAGAARVTTPRRAVVVGGGIAGLAAACGLLERGVEVELIEPELQLGGRVRAWNLETEAGSVTMSRGFHAFFRQYYNLRALLQRAGNLDELLRPVDDYPVVSSRGDRDSFTRIPRTPPWNFITFVLRSPTFTARDLTKVDLDTALSLLDVDFPATYRELDGLSAAEFLDRLKFPDRARHLALEVFARSFFADPRKFSAGELVAMFHSYFLGSAEGLLFDVPRDDFDTSLWRPLGDALAKLGLQRTTGRVASIERDDVTETWRTVLTDGRCIDSDAVVLAAGPSAARDIVAASTRLASVAPRSEATMTPAEWLGEMARVELAPPFAVYRLWFDGKVADDRPAFLGTADYGPLDNISIMERFEAGATAWSDTHDGSVVELHAYAIPPEYRGEGEPQAELAARLRAELARVYPETAELGIVAEQLLIEQDCALIGVNSWDRRPEVTTPVPGLVLAGDWVRCDLPIALMERAATTGWMAANELLQGWGARGHELWSAPITARQSWPGAVRRLIRRMQRNQTSPEK